VGGVTKPDLLEVFRAPVKEGDDTTGDDAIDAEEPPAAVLEPGA
jgi:hypothetical protein